jgi:quercetin dioxygenase-like cupin family protein
MSEPDYQVRQLADESSPPESGKNSTIVLDDDRLKVILFSFASGSGLAEHVAPFTAIIQIISGEAEMTVGDQPVAGKAGTWIQMKPKTPHSIQAQTPVTLLLTLLKEAA